MSHFLQNGKEIRKFSYLNVNQHQHPSPEDNKVIAPEFIALDTLLAMEIAEPRWVIQNILPEGVSLLLGKPNAGKSWLALDMALSVASGRPALRCFPVNRGNVLYMDLEESNRHLKARSQKILQAQAAPGGLTFSLHWNLLKYGGLADLEDVLEAQPELRLVVIDSLTCLYAVGKHRLEREDCAVMFPLKEMAEAYHVAILLLHHLSPFESSDNNYQLLQLALPTELAQCTLLLRENSHKESTLSVVGRDLEYQNYAIQFDPALARWELIPCNIQKRHSRV